MGRAGEHQLVFLIEVSVSPFNGLSVVPRVHGQSLDSQSIETMLCLD